MGAVLFWVVLLGVLVGATVASVVRRRRQLRRIEAQIAAPGAAAAITIRDVEQIRRPDGGTPLPEMGL